MKTAQKTKVSQHPPTLETKQFAVTVPVAIESNLCGVDGEGDDKTVVAHKKRDPLDDCDDKKFEGEYEDDPSVVIVPEGYDAAKDSDLSCNVGHQVSECIESFRNKFCLGHQGSECIDKFMLRTTRRRASGNEGPFYFDVPLSVDVVGAQGQRSEVQDPDSKLEANRSYEVRLGRFKVDGHDWSEEEWNYVPSLFSLVKLPPDGCQKWYDSLDGQDVFQYKTCVEPEGFPVMQK